ncbi:MAG: hypothetical protein KF773_23550 [Deltaproteobacteria bacterium]|nr:hypothetical protein [Deltaproteobacteria bacterium]MCW5804006.1 hypothetical protein [Deltaproteobacteria bacterium]
MREVLWGENTCAGGIAATSWLYARGLCAVAGGWDIAIFLPVRGEDDASLHLAITSSEWGFLLRRGARSSWIRVTDQPFVHERDDFGLLHHIPPLEHIGELVRGVEERDGIRFDRGSARIETNLANAAPRLRRWISYAL